MKLKFTYSLFVLALVFSINKSYGQNIIFDAVFTDTSLKVNKLINYNSEITLNQLPETVREVTSYLHRQAFLLATLDSITIDSSYYKGFFTLGKTYKWNALKNKNIDEEVLSRVGYRDKFFNNKPFSAKQLNKFFTRIITYYENHGYPFASIQLDSITIAKNKLTALLVIEKNKFYQLDSIIIKGNATITHQYFTNYIKLKENDFYNEKIIKNLSTKIKEISFVTEDQPWKILFNEDESKLYVYLKKKAASKFNGVLGVLPDDKTGKLQLTGDVKLNLINSFRNGEKIGFNWRSIQKNTQDLNFSIMYPFLFSSPFGVDYNFKLYKKDTTFIDVAHKIGVRYIMKGNNYFSVFYHNKNSSLLSKTNLKNLTVLPSYADVNTQLYGVSIYNENLDYLLNPKKGYRIDFSSSIGNKVIKKNPVIDEKLYEDINLKTTLYDAKLNAEFYFPLSQRNVIKLGSRNGYTFNENLFENELLRIGGLLTLRGFDEESIFASLYTIETIEYRFILEQNSYLFAFFDGAFYENDNINGYVVDRPFGFGAGMSFETKAGIFSISYALGKQFDNPILFRSGKVHFGFVNFF